MVSSKVTVIAGRSAMNDKKEKEYLRISPLHRQVLQASCNRRKTAGPSPRCTLLPTEKPSGNADASNHSRRRARDSSSTLGPEPVFPEELARQWGWTDDSWKYMALHRIKSGGWVRMREPIDDFERGIMGLPPLPPDVVEVRLEERRREDLEMLMKRHGVKPKGACEGCEELGKAVRICNSLALRQAHSIAQCDGGRPSCAGCDLWGMECTYRRSSTGDDIRQELLLKMKADIDAAADKFDKLAVSPTKEAQRPTERHDMEIESKVEDSQPRKIKPLPARRKAKTAERQEVTQCVSAAHPSCPVVQKKIPAQTLGAAGNDKANPMDICMPELQPPPLVTPSLSASSTASSSSSSSLISTPVDGDDPMPRIVRFDGTKDAPRPAAQQPKSVVEGRDDEAKAAAYAILGLSKAPPRPSTMSHAPPAPKAHPIPVVRVPKIIITPPARELVTVETITALLAKLTLSAVPAAVTTTIEGLLSSRPWVSKYGSRSAEGMEDDDEVARMLGELVDEHVRAGSAGEQGGM
ncbi:hypothetical protein EVJ58_g5187 [Rhodofomes roseus]|uniref:Zn(2)-C6 fungal-type domain-containing protein n=1 Tax=Rhodofomes roseus TaxID=34475 RepID=A0A4Y9YDG4_9APHY|nr:hypothetical protein EVJ58_g5187 [Rhodofomes roseus]